MEKLTIEERCLISVALKQMAEKLEGFIKYNEENISDGKNIWITNKWKEDIENINILLLKL